MRYAIEAWATEYGAPVEEADALVTPQHPPLLDVEVGVPDSAPRRAPAGEAAGRVVFTDGVRRVDARVWIDGGGGETRLGLCASYAAGVVQAGACGAEVLACKVERGLFSAAPDASAIVTRYATYPSRLVDDDNPERLSLALQQRMGELEVCLAAHTGDADLVVIDGPLRGRQHIANAVGYVKTHHVAYLPPAVAGVVAALQAGERTPLFVTTSSWSRFCWYLRLPGAAGHAWAGVVRCEASADLDVADAVSLADLTAVTLPRYASKPHKDPRAPQNLYPIAGLERALRHRLGDSSLLYRGLRISAA